MNKERLSNNKKKNIKCLKRKKKKRKMPMYRKKKIPASLRQTVWITYNGEVFRAKCHVSWCRNTITPFTFEVGHNKPESRGGMTTIENLLPICSSCNRSMGNTYTITEYCERFSQLRKNNIQNQVVVPRRSFFNLFMKPFHCFRIF